MTFIEYIPLLTRLVLAVLIGGIIGLERSESNHEAGLRTHILVCVGSATVMVLSEVVAKQYGNDVTRMGAQVISGIGFLGAGSIVIDQTKNKIKGITTAAGIWTTACIGLVVGMGYYIISIFVFFLMIFTMLGLKPLAKKLRLKVKVYNVHAEAETQERVEQIYDSFKELKMEINSFSLQKEDGNYIMDVELSSNMIMTKSELVAELSEFFDVKKIMIS